MGNRQFSSPALDQTQIVLDVPVFYQKKSSLTLQREYHKRPKGPAGDIEVNNWSEGNRSLLDYKQSNRISGSNLY